MVAFFHTGTQSLDPETLSCPRCLQGGGGASKVHRHSLGPYLISSVYFLAEGGPLEPVEPLDEELPVVEQLLDIWLLERWRTLLL